MFNIYNIKNRDDYVTTETQKVLYLFILSVLVFFNAYFLLTKSLLFILVSLLIIFWIFYTHKCVKIKDKTKKSIFDEDDDFFVFANKLKYKNEGLRYLSFFLY